MYEIIWKELHQWLRMEYVKEVNKTGIPVNTYGRVLSKIEELEMKGKEDVQ